MSVVALVDPEVMMQFGATIKALVANGQVSSYAHIYFALQPLHVTAEMAPDQELPSAKWGAVSV